MTAGTRGRGRRRIRLVDLYGDREGRIGRRAFVLGLVPPALLSAVGAALVVALFGRSIVLSTTGAVVAIAAAPLLVTITAKRLHDVSRRGLLALPVVVPVLGPVVALAVLGPLPGTRGPNGYGPDPRDP